MLAIRYSTMCNVLGCQVWIAEEGLNRFQFRHAGSTIRALGFLGEQPIANSQ
jgi:hypothetical protein